VKLLAVLRHWDAGFAIRHQLSQAPSLMLRGRRALVVSPLPPLHRTVSDNFMVRNFLTHGQLSAAQGSPTNCLSTLITF
jgi:hypothetical protein